MEQSQTNGYLIVKGLFDPQDDLEPVVKEYEGVLDNLANELHAKCAIKGTYADVVY